MKKKLIPFHFLAIVLMMGTFYSCNEKADSKPTFIFKPAPSQGVAAKILGKNVTEQELFKGIEGDIYEAEQKVYDLKMDKLRAFMLEKFMENHPEKKGLSNDEFLEKHISSGKGPTDSEIEKFIKEKNIPEQHINDQLKDRVRKYLDDEMKRKAVDVWLNSQTDKNPVEIYLTKPYRPVFEVEAGDAPSFGDSDAKVTIVEFSDFQCPYCARGSAILADIKKKYGNKVKVAFRNFPLPFHQNAKLAAEAGLCAHEQGKDYFWKLHDAMFAEQEKLGADDLKAKAKKIGLDAGKFDKCLTDHKFAGKVDEDLAYGEKVGVKSTPTFFVNGKLINGAQTMDIFSEVIDEEMDK